MTDTKSESDTVEVSKKDLARVKRRFRDRAKRWREQQKQQEAPKKG